VESGGSQVETPEEEEMAAIGDGSVRQIASSVVQSVAGGRYSTPVQMAGIETARSIGDSMEKAFAGLRQPGQGSARGAGELSGAIQPFSPPNLPAGGPIGIVKEAIGCFREIGGAQPANAAGLPQLDDIDNLFDLLEQIVAADKFIASKPNQNLR
jgi:hypothetical protein